MSAPTSKPADALTYAAAGVDIEAGNEAVRRIKKMVARTRRPEQIDGLGGFAGLMGLPTGLTEPILVSCTDGVGTKLLVAIAMGKHDTVGIDLVAMNVNDLLCTGGSPLFLLDYIATGKLETGVIEGIVSGVVEGCVQSNCALIGGETAELPGMYAEGHFDLAATAVGVVEKSKIWAPHCVREGDAVIALPSNGLHSNGYSLARRALLDANYAGMTLASPLAGSGMDVGEALLQPTRIYAAQMRKLHTLQGSPIHGAAHITGGGLLENPQRALPEDLMVELDLSELPLPPVLAAIHNQGVDDTEMLRTFNCGVGMLLYVDPQRVDEICALLGEGVRAGKVMAAAQQQENLAADRVRILHRRW